MHWAHPHTGLPPQSLCRKAWRTWRPSSCRAEPRTAVSSLEGHDSSSCRWPGSWTNTFSIGTAGDQTSAASACTSRCRSTSEACRTCRPLWKQPQSPVEILTPPSCCWKALQTPSWWWARWRWRWGWGGRRGTQPGLQGKQRVCRGSSPAQVANNPHIHPSWPWRRT